MKKFFKRSALTLLVSAALISPIMANDLSSGANGPFYCSVFPWLCATTNGAGGSGHGCTPTTCKEKDD